MKNLTQIMLLLVALLLSSCEKPFGLDDNVNQKDKVNLEFSVVHDSNKNLMMPTTNERLTFIIKSKVEETDFINTYPLNDPGMFGDIDYNKKMVLGIIWPTQNSGSTKFAITKLELVGGKIEVSSKKVADGMTTDIGYPMFFIVIDKTDLPFEFKTTQTSEEPEEQEGANLIDSNWKLYQYSIDGGTTWSNSYENAKLFKDAFFTLNFTKEFINIGFKEDISTLYVTGFANLCNLFTTEANVKKAESNIEFGTFSNDGDLCEFSGKYQEFLSQMKKYNVKPSQDGNILDLTSADGQIQLRFVQYDIVSLAEGQWELDQILSIDVNGNVIEEKTDNFTPTTFTLNKGKFDLSAECFNWTGFYFVGVTGQLTARPEDWEEKCDNDGVIIQTIVSRPSPVARVINDKLHIFARQNGLYWNELIFNKK